MNAVDRSHFRFHQTAFGFGHFIVSDIPVGIHFGRLQISRFRNEINQFYPILVSVDVEYEIMIVFLRAENQSPRLSGIERKISGINHAFRLIERSLIQIKPVSVRRRQNEFLRVDLAYRRGNESADDERPQKKQAECAFPFLFHFASSSFRYRNTVSRSGRGSIAPFPNVFKAPQILAKRKVRSRNPSFHSSLFTSSNCDRTPP